MADILNMEDYKQILQNRFHGSNIKLLHTEVKPISENIEGFVGEHYHIIITYESNGVQKIEVLFLKNKPKNGILREFANENLVYQKEIFLYNVLLKEFEKYGYDVSFAGSCFYFIPDETIVMEDLVKMGYQLPVRNQYYDISHLKCLLKSLALYHGAGFAYEQTKSKELGRVFTIEQEWSHYFNEVLFQRGSTKMGEIWDGTLTALNDLITLLPKDESYKKDFQHMLKTYDVSVPFVKKTKFAKTCGHGDLWSNNMFFKYENGIPYKCCLIDFQFIRYFYPSFDILLAIHSNTSSQFRNKHLLEMYQFYYNTLLQIVANYGYFLEEIMPLSDFFESLRLVKVIAMMQYSMNVSIVYLPKEILTTSFNDGNMENVLYKDKKAMNSKAFQTDTKFREVVSDAMYDLYEALDEYRKHFS